MLANIFISLFRILFISKDLSCLGADGGRLLSLRESSRGMFSDEGGERHFYYWCSSGYLLNKDSGISSALFSILMCFY
jgi:hypothetical protein